MPRSCNLYADSHLTSNQVSVRFVPAESKIPGFDCNIRSNDASSVLHFRSASWHSPDYFLSLFHLRSAPQLLVAAPKGGLNLHLNADSRGLPSSLTKHEKIAALHSPFVAIFLQDRLGRLRYLDRKIIKNNFITTLEKID